MQGRCKSARLIIAAGRPYAAHSIKSMVEAESPAVCCRGVALLMSIKRPFVPYQYA
jgi:hypothetical protein